MPARVPMTTAQRDRLLALPDDEPTIVRHHSLTTSDLAAIASARTPATRLGYALQLCCLRYPGRHLRAGEVLPAIMLDHIAEQVGVEAAVVADFARRTPTRYDQLVTIKARFGHVDLTRPLRAELRPWLEAEAAKLTDGRVLLDRFIDELRSRRVVIPGVSVVERMTAESMVAAERRLIAEVEDGMGRSPVLAWMRSSTRKPTTARAASPGCGSRRRVSEVRRSARSWTRLKQSGERVPEPSWWRRFMARNWCSSRARASALQPRLSSRWEPRAGA